MKKSLQTPWYNFIVLILILFSFNYIQAQEINSLGDVDVSKFPKVSFKINVYNPEVKEKSSFEVLENNKKVDFDLEVLDVENDKKNKVVLILFEDMFKHGNQRNAFKKILNKALPEMVNEGDQVNIAFFDRNRDGSTPLRFALNEFTDDADALLESVNSYNKAPDRFNTQKSSDLYNAIYDAVTYLKDNFEGKDKLIVVMSGGKNLELSNYNSISDIINYAKKYKIPVYSMQYMVFEHENIDELANNTYGKYFHIQGTYKLKGDHSISTAADTLVSFMNQALDRMQGRNYQISYQSEFDKDGKSHMVVVKTDDNTKEISFTAPVCNFKCWFEKNKKLAIGIGAGLLLLLLLLTYLIKRRNKKRRLRQEQEALLIKQQLEQQEEELLEQKMKAQELERMAKEELRKKEEEKRMLLAQQKEKEEKERIQKIIRQMKRLRGFSKLRVVNPDKSFFDWEIKYPEISVGSGSHNDLIVNDRTVSSNHLKIYFRNNEYYIEDLGSTNGTFVNGQKIKGEKKLNHNDTIQIGKTKMIFIL